MFFYFFFFFFQAEVGIRDLTVTGVQTCALPISTIALASGCSELDSTAAACAIKSSRSEERRVGKECRYRWSPYHSQKKKRKKMPSRSECEPELSSHDSRAVLKAK